MWILAFCEERMSLAVSDLRPSENFRRQIGLWPFFQPQAAQPRLAIEASSGQVAFPKSQFITSLKKIPLSEIPEAKLEIQSLFAGNGLCPNCESQTIKACLALKFKMAAGRVREIKSPPVHQLHKMAPVVRIEMLELFDRPAIAMMPMILDGRNRQCPIPQNFHAPHGHQKAMFARLACRRLGCVHSKIQNGRRR